jgi:hypothetical protein
MARSSRPPAARRPHQLEFGHLAHSDPTLVKDIGPGSLYCGEAEEPVAGAGVDQKRGTHAERASPTSPNAPPSLASSLSRRRAARR